MFAASKTLLSKLEAAHRIDKLQVPCKQHSRTTTLTQTQRLSPLGLSQRTRSPTKKSPALDSHHTTISFALSTRRTAAGECSKTPNLNPSPQLSTCCSAWGHNFRKDYLQLKMLKQQACNHHPHHNHYRHFSGPYFQLCPAFFIPSPQFERVPLLALTATASPRVVDDVKSILKMRGVVFRTKTDRPNLVYRCGVGVGVGVWVWKFGSC
jgi:hypothetical protein